MRGARALIAIGLIALPGLMLAPVWPLAGLGAGEDDLLYYFPSRHFFHESIRDGHMPWINPWTGLGRPYAADPQSAVWYPFTWLFAALGPSLAYALSLWLHYSLAAWGLYRLLRSGYSGTVADRSLAGRPPDGELPGAGMGHCAALFGAVAFAFCGFLLAHRAHFTMVQSAAWIPWLFWRVRRYALVGGTRRLAQASGLAALQCLAGHVQIAALTALGLLVYLIAAAPAARRRAIVRWALTWTCAAGLFAVQLLPTLAYLRQCTRSDRAFWQFVENSWNPASLVGWITPMLYGQRTPNFFDQPYWGPSHQSEQFSYPGILPLLLAGLALSSGGARRERRAWLVLGVFAVLMALGPYGPICPLLYLIPGSNLFRVPARAMVLANLAIAVLSAAAVNDLAGLLSSRRAAALAGLGRWTRRPFLRALVIVAVPLVLVAAAALWVDAPTRAAMLTALRPTNPAVFVPLIVVCTSLCALAIVAKEWRRPRIAWVLVGVLAVDLGVVGWTIDVPAQSARDQLAAMVRDPTSAEQRPPWTAFVREQPHRVWVVTARRDGVPGEYRDPLRKGVANTNVLWGVASLTDYGPLQPRSMQQRFDFAPWGETALAADLLADTAWTRAYDVGWILVCEPEWAAPSDCDLVATTPDGMRLYYSPRAAGRAFLADPAAAGAVRHVEHAPHDWTTHVDAAGARGGRVRLVAASLALDGWQATLDGEPLEIERYAGNVMSVVLPADRPVSIRWSYFPPGLLAGAAISITSFVLLVAFVLSSAKRDGTTTAAAVT